MVKKDTNKSYSWVGFGNIFFLTVILFSVIVTPAKADPPNPNQGECFSYAYTESGDHIFLIDSNKSVFGDYVTIKHNCDYIEVLVNGNFTAFTEENKLIIPLDFGLQNITILSNNYSYSVTNLTVFPDRLAWEYEYNQWMGGDYSLQEFIELSKAQARENTASIISIIIVFSLVTFVYWNLINSYIDRNYCEEVIS